MWPAFWMLGQNIWQIGWPKCGEIDIMEHINSDSVIHGTMHWDNNGHQSFGGTKKCDASQFHVYSIEWDNTMIKWFVDGVKYKEGYTYNNINNTEEFHKPFYLILNLAIGGNWPGSPNAQTSFPDSMLVDYVRVYQKSTTLGTDVYSSNKLAIYPNPIVNHAIVKATAEFENGIISISDINGKEIYKSVATYPETPIQIDFLPKGVYLINLSTKKFITRNKFIKE
jgi:beta-glucanase (GH16 family)